MFTLLKSDVYIAHKSDVYIPQKTFQNNVYIIPKDPCVQYSFFTLQ